jgi:hypothetical protein
VQEGLAWEIGIEMSTLEMSTLEIIQTYETAGYAIGLSIVAPGIILGSGLSNSLIFQR